MKLKYPANKIIKVVSAKQKGNSLEINVKLTKFANDFIDLLNWYENNNMNVAINKTTHQRVNFYEVDRWQIGIIDHKTKKHIEYLYPRNFYDKYTVLEAEYLK